MSSAREKLLDIRDKLVGRVLVEDGAVGTLLAERGLEQPYNGANLTHAECQRRLPHASRLDAALGWRCN